MKARDSGSILDGKYEILGPLARGGMGEVYKARHLHLHELRVIKILRRDLAGDPALSERFLREARIATQIKHPNVAILHDTARLPDGTYYMAWEHVDGLDLARRLREKGPIEPALAVELAIQALRGLEALHTAGVVHRDISPDNLIVRADAKGRPQLKVIDLGLARSLHLPAASELEQTDAGMVLGKWRYCSPEQAGASGGVVDLRSDLYSLAAVLYEMLSGLPPFDSETQQGFVLKRLSEEPLPLASRNPAVRVPVALAEAVHRGLARDPADRFPDAVAFIRALVRVADLLRGVSTVEMEVPLRPKPRLDEAPPAPHTGRTAPSSAAAQRLERTASGVRELSPTERSGILAEIERAADRRAARAGDTPTPTPSPRLQAPPRPAGPGTEEPIHPEHAARIQDTQELLERYLADRRAALARLALGNLLELAPNHPSRTSFELRIAQLEGGVDFDRRVEEEATKARAAMLRMDLESARRTIEQIARLEASGAQPPRSAELFAELSRAEAVRRQAGEAQQRRERVDRAIEMHAFDDAEEQIAALVRLRTPKVVVDGFRDRLADARRLAEGHDLEAMHEADFRDRLTRGDWSGAREVARRLEHVLPASELPSQWLVEVGRSEEARRRQQSIDQGLAQVEAYLAAGRPADAELALKIVLRLDPKNPNRKRLERQIETLWQA